MKIDQLTLGFKLEVCFMEGYSGNDCGAGRRQELDLTSKTWQKFRLYFNQVREVRKIFTYTCEACEEVLKKFDIACISQGELPIMCNFEKSRSDITVRPWRHLRLYICQRDWKIGPPAPESVDF